MNRTHARRGNTLRGVSATNRHMDMRRRRRAITQRINGICPRGIGTVVRDALARLDTLGRTELLP